MLHHAQSIQVETPGRGTSDITQHLQQIVQDSGADVGVCTVFVHHTSASLIICEHADPAVRRDLERFAARLVPDGFR